MIPRIITDLLVKSLVPKNVLVLYGPRQIGKTTLVEHILTTHFSHERILRLSGDRFDVQKIAQPDAFRDLEDLIRGYTLLFIDEAQKIQNIGLTLKLLVDTYPHLRIVVTGSSSFHLKKAFGEPLVGRKSTYHLYSIAQMELQQQENILETQGNLETRLIYGGYPEILRTDMSPLDRQQYLADIVSNYLYKDILELENIQHRSKIIDLLSMLAFQIGHEVSVTELATHLGMSRNTVEKYLYYLEEAFVLYRLRGFSRNLRKEITKTCRYYFYDNGVRNAIIHAWNPISRRDDIGMLWENYIVMERLKKQSYTRWRGNNYFWRTHDQKEIDWVEDADDFLHGYEIKWGTKIPKAPALWTKTYSHSTYSIINPETYLDFIQ